MKKYIIFFFIVSIFIFGCSEITYIHDSEIDYDIYHIAYVMPVNNTTQNFISNDDVQYFTASLVSNIRAKSDFRNVIDGYLFLQPDSTDCIVETVIYDFDDKDTYENNKRYYEIKTKVKCRVKSKTNQIILNWFYEEATKKEEEDIWGNINITELRKNCVKEALDKVSHKFLKDFEIK